ncbi:MAG: DUF5752 family protein [Vicinamibacteria bacterium]|nr:DUF5752 family protein [Vicinamibacteria bacterium]
MAEPFRFWGCTELAQSLGALAEGERELHERLERAPHDSLLYHTARTLLRRRAAPLAWPNDFAIWAATDLHDPELAERLAFGTPFDFASVEAYRDHLLGVLDDHLARLSRRPRPTPLRPFRFLRGHLAAVPIGLEAVDLASFRAALAEADESSVYFHAVESLGRGVDRRGDFAAWVGDVLGEPAAAAALQAPDPFVLGLGGARARMIAGLDAVLARTT